ncbi:DUF4190 domain-containing protein [Streptomyces violascens]|uniref:DUF4352 domain-containing protein n=1 Tax=Streptomyces violascens TaxID=67381 RepID=A0ABQ3QKF8_9ACTN|nr:DUF4190 domain-containing protein [Streptomyces violascens]GGT93909.1 hypothetical protein GCM10010289_12460 [Streptomyces violascens]GHI37704.1 hypothetical protein Sviol_21120 [Streptomyces violascens]
MTVPVNSPGQPQWGPPPPGRPGPPQAPAQQARNGLGAASLVLGVVGAGFGLVPFLFWLSGTLGVLAVVLGLAGHGRARKGGATNRGVALAGSVLGGIATVLGIAGLLLTVVFVKDAAKSPGGTIPKAPSSAASSSAPGPNPAPSTPPAQKPQPFGATHAYPDGVKVTVSKPAPYTPDASASGHRKGNRALRFTVTIVNDSAESIDITSAVPTLRGSDGIEAEAIYDDEHATSMFAGALEPGGRATGKFAFSVPPESRTVDFQIGPQTLKYDETVWSGPVVTGTGPGTGPGAGSGTDSDPSPVTD